MIAPPVREWTPPFQNEATCHMTSSAHSLFLDKERSTPQRQLRLTSGTGLHMNYSIIFTEISFYQETYSVTNKSNNSYDISEYTRI